MSIEAQFISENLMGPNSVIILSELARELSFSSGMRVLDLGCGRGLTSFYLAQRFDVTVFATDLWVPAAENWERARSLGLEDRVIPIHADAHSLPFAEGFFDVVLSVDSYHYFGTSDSYLCSSFAPLVKKRGQLAIAVPGLTEEFDNGVPEEFKPLWSPEMNTFHSHKWWRNLWERSGLVEIKESKGLVCHREAWRSWLNSDNQYAKGDIPFFQADINSRLATVAVVATKK